MEIKSTLKVHSPKKKDWTLNWRHFCFNHYFEKNVSDILLGSNVQSYNKGITLKKNLDFNGLRSRLVLQIYLHFLSVITFFTNVFSIIKTHKKVNYMKKISYIKKMNKLRVNISVKLIAKWFCILAHLQMYFLFSAHTNKSMDFKKYLF